MKFVLFQCLKLILILCQMPFIKDLKFSSQIELKLPTVYHWTPMPSTKLGWVTKIIACFLHQKYSHLLFPPASFFPDCCQNYICRKLKWLFLEVSKYQNLCDSFIRHFLAISTLTYWMVAKRVGKPFDCFFCYLGDLKKVNLCKNINPEFFDHQ